MKVSGILKDENDVMIIGFSIFARIFTSLIVIGFGTLLILGVFSEKRVVWQLFMIVFGGLIFLFGLQCMVDESIIIDKKSQSVFLKKNSKTIKEILFSDIYYIQIVKITTAENE